MSKPLLPRVQRAMLIATSACLLLSVVLAIIRLSGHGDLPWLSIVAPVLLALALWAAIAVSVYIVLWFLVRVGKDIP